MARIARSTKPNRIKPTYAVKKSKKVIRQNPLKTLPNMTSPFSFHWMTADTIPKNKRIKIISQRNEIFQIVRIRKWTEITSRKVVVSSASPTERRWLPVSGLDTANTRTYPSRGRKMNNANMDDKIVLNQFPSRSILFPLPFHTKPLKAAPQFLFRLLPPGGIQGWRPLPFAFPHQGPSASKSGFPM